MIVLLSGRGQSWLLLSVCQSVRVVVHPIVKIRGGLFSLSLFLATGIFSISFSTYSLSLSQTGLPARPIRWEGRFFSISLSLALSFSLLVSVFYLTAHISHSLSVLLVPLPSFEPYHFLLFLFFLPVRAHTHTDNVWDKVITHSFFVYLSLFLHRCACRKFVCLCLLYKLSEHTDAIVFVAVVCLFRF